MKHCTECGSVLEPNWDFCKSCGHAVLKSEAIKSVSTTISDFKDSSSSKGSGGLRKISFVVFPILAIGLLGIVLASKIGGAAHYSTFQQLQSALVKNNICKSFEPAARKDEKGLLVFCETNKKFPDGSGYARFWVNFNSDIQIPVKDWKPTAVFYNKIPQSNRLKVSIAPDIFPTIVGENWIMYDPVGSGVSGEFSFTKNDLESYAKALGGQYLRGKYVP